MGKANEGGDADFAEETKFPELKIDPKQAPGFIKFFNSLPEDRNVVRFFDRKDYYTTHGENATFVAKTYYKTLTALRLLGNPPNTLPSVSISFRLFETILRDLLLDRTDFKVEIFEGSGSNFRLSKTGTPGKLGEFEDVLFSTNEMQDSPVVMAVQFLLKENERLVGLSFVDMTKRVLGCTEFLDDDQFTNLESAMISLGCKEMVIPLEGGNSPDGKKLRDVILRCNCLVTEKKKSTFKSRDVEGDLARLLKGGGGKNSSLSSSSSSSHPPLFQGSLESELSAGSLASLLSYTELLTEDSNYGKFTLQPFSLNTYMRLDSSALRALNVLESKTDANKNFSLFGLMNRTSTAGMGKRLLNRWLKQPLLDVKEIEKRHNSVQCFVESAETRIDLRTHLKRIPDIERIVRKVERKKANLQDVVKLYQASVRLPFIKESLQRYEGEFSPFLKDRFGNALEEWIGTDHLGKYDGLVEAAVDLERLEEGEYIISAGYDASLGEIKEERERVGEEVRKVHLEVAKDLGLVADKSLKLDKVAQHGFAFRITKKEETQVRKKLNSSYTTLETRKDGIKFSNAKLWRLSEKFLKLTEEYSNTQKELVAKVVEVAATFVEVFEGVAALLAELDVLLSFADLAVSAPTPYVRPTVTPQGEGDIVLEGSRHPCVEVQDDVSFIPNDCRLERGKSWFQIITGPNMGGKSTFIRQVGVNVLMAQVGCFVPCDSAQISVRDCIFARVGAGDCQLRGVSTFMAEMLETAAILKSATQNSLIIIDELGRGTSTYDGFGLAWAICEYLVEVTRGPTLFATHFHELTSLSHSLSLSQNFPVHGNSKGPSVGIANYHVSAHIDESSRKLTMLYKVEDGPCDQSFGIHVAEFAHFPESVVKMAREKAEQLEDFSPQEPAIDVEASLKRKRVSRPDDEARGAARARKFLREFAALPLDEMSPEEAGRQVARLKKEMDADLAENPWLQQIV